MPPAQPRHAPYVHPAALQVGAGSLWVCEGTCDVLAVLAAGVARVVVIVGVQGWRWDWIREVRELVFALDADTAGQQWRILVRQAALREKRVAVLPPEASGGHNDVNEAWVARALAVRTKCTPAAETGARRDHARGRLPAVHRRRTSGLGGASRVPAVSDGFPRWV